MYPKRLLLILLLLPTCLIAAPGTASAAGKCTGYIDSVPAVVSKQGVWCLRKNLSTGITSGNAISVATNNVTIDCNHFKIGGLPGGSGTMAIGIQAGGRVNTTVRHCSIRGFLFGVALLGPGGGGHVVEDNHFDGNTFAAIEVQGDGSVVRGNQVNDTGGSTALPGSAYGIRTRESVDVLDNSVSGVLPAANGDGNGGATGIYTASNANGSISGNRVGGLVSLGIVLVRAIYNSESGRIILRDNDVSGNGSATGRGLYCADGKGHAKGNIINGFNTAISNCSDDGNVSAL